MRKPLHDMSLQELAVLAETNDKLSGATNLCKAILARAIKSGDTSFLVEVTTEGMGTSEVRLMVDCESDRRDLWIEYATSSQPVRLVDGDVVVKFS